MKRFCFLLAVAGFLAGGVQQPTAAQPQIGQAEELDLKKQLEQGLRARLPSEFAFVAKVVDEVEQGRLKRSLVDAVYGWARKKTRHQFQYFEFAMRKKAAALGVSL